MEEYKELEKAASEMNSARKTYLAAYGKIASIVIRQWRGDDPVTSIYREVFSASRVVEHDLSLEDAKREWQKRLLNKIPPGYKDGGKDDQGVGDFIIWMSLLRLGRENKRDLIFVTGEEKIGSYERATNRFIQGPN